ncbi:hypothetical protein MM239_18365 [Belliella sp. DSM 111904]|uniref:Lipocalin-like domain-containing protein n=1 Tax=Belliella filtrata TaxID=2923435 RepID=A0ABS9V4M6_9BACT|nr:hypothetical protein [Belliella filtrata]MCH7411365.1 hypothetical protein [Belliella filtrata]
MKKNMIGLLVATAFAFQSCDDYPDGPLVSLKSKTERVANDWKIGEALDEGTDITSDYERYELSLTKDGEAILTANYNLLGINYEFTTSGTWVFLSNETKLSFDFENDDADGIYEILRLKEDELWLKEDAGTIELHFMPR